MVQNPINVYPDNGITFDKTSSENDTRLSFTFKGDNLKAYCVRFFDYNTGEIPVSDAVVYDYDTELMQYNILAYNNENVTLYNAFNGLNNVGSYIMQFMLVGGLTNTGGVAADRFVLRGELQEDYVSGETSFVVENRINSIYEWDTSSPIKKPVTVIHSGTTFLLNVMELRIGNESQRILSYNYDTGEIILINRLSNNYDAGTPYQIYSNYLVTPQYYFNTAIRPQIVAMNAEWDAYGVKFSAVYSQPQYHFLKYYTITMQKKSSTNVYYNVAKTGRRYSQKIEYVFTDDYDYKLDVARTVADENERFALTADDVEIGDVIRQNDLASKLDKINNAITNMLSGEGLNSAEVWELLDMDTTGILTPIIDDNGKWIIQPEQLEALEEQIIRLSREQVQSDLSDKYYYVADINNLNNENGYSKFYPIIGGNDDTRIYRFIINAIGQDGTDITAYSEDFVAPERNETVRIDRVLSAKAQKNNNGIVSIILAGDYNSIRVYRIDGKNIDQYGSYPIKTLIGDFWGSGAFDDYTASTHGEYVYMLVPYYGTAVSSEINRAILTDKITTSEYGYTITAIYDSGKDVNGLPFFLIGDTWKFITDIDDTTVVQNTDKTLHSGFGKYSSLTSTQTNFMSGTLSAGIGNVSCSSNRYNDTIEMVRAWRKFITQDCQFILRSQKGDVWVVNVTDNPTTQYQENVPQLFTTIEFNWAECCGINEIITGTDEPSRMQER